ncbi:hypothetical protein G5I_11591 [Acromyrmex echinatior]|uniref:Uncharacterized protein n=1 Tax=Acromyrmex echinatior TaxID=103372 RepID=F4X009_ACREC|nr:hypothetical protein G5I_11591 [Acromyrmex echinatior]
MRGYSDRVNGEGKEGSRRTFHGDVTSYSGTRAACNERFRNYSSVVYRRRAFDLERNSTRLPYARIRPSVHPARFGHREFVATFVSFATDEEESLWSEEILVREVSLEDFLEKDIVKTNGYKSGIGRTTIQINVALIQQNLLSARIHTHVHGETNTITESCVTIMLNVDKLSSSHKENCFIQEAVIIIKWIM